MYEYISEQRLSVATKIAHGEPSMQLSIGSHGRSV